MIFLSVFVNHYYNQCMSLKQALYVTMGMIIIT